MKPLSNFQAQLQSIAEELGRREVHLAQLGSSLRQKVPEFSLLDYGCATLTELLGSCVTVGRLRFGERPEDRWFIFNSDGLLDSGAFQIPVDDGVRSVRIAKPIWDRCVDIDGPGGWLDLQVSGQIETDPDTVRDEPERYIKLPHFDRARQAVLVEKFLARVDSGHDLGVVVSAAAEWRATTSPYTELLRMFQEHGLKRQWLAELRDAVERELRGWAGEHGIPPSGLFERRQRPPRATAGRASEGPVRPLNERELRAFLKSAIDAMTLAELCQWSVPVRLLLK